MIKMVKCENCKKEVARRKAYVQGQQVKMVCQECYKELGIQAYKGLCNAIIRERKRHGVGDIVM